MTHKFTPGPWHAHYPSWHPWENAIAISDGMGADICWTTTEPAHDAQANAHLIAAAPDLLNALILCEGFCRGHQESPQKVDRYRKVAAAIAKATGAA